MGLYSGYSVWSTVKMSLPTPEYNITIDATNEDTVKQGCIKVLMKVRPDWPSSELNLKMFTDGLTNKLVGAWYKDKKDLVLVRIYGEDTDKFIDRDNEKRNMKKLEEGGCGSKLYASFTNGLSYEFVAGDTLELEKLFDPQVYREVARSMARIHKLPIETEQLEMWNFLEKLLKLYPDKFNDSKKQEMFQTHLLTKNQLKQEVANLKERLASTKSPIVFCHNDAMPANMVLKEDKTIALIDMEYAGPNHAAYDLANLFNEYIGCDEFLDYKRNYPNECLVRDWIYHYLAEFSGDVPSKDEICSLYQEVGMFSICGHLIWSTWAVIQAVNSEIDFDYIDYARQRLDQYWFVKKFM